MTVDGVHPLRTVRLRNFKSVVDAEVRIAPLTVLVGANSSGKSSIIQALLALHQVAGNESPLSSFALNGPKVGLGFLTKVRHFGASPDAPVEIGVDVRLQRTAPGAFGIPNFGLMHQLRQSPLHLSLRLGIGPGDEGDNSNETAPPVTRTDFHVESGTLRTSLRLSRRTAADYRPGSDVFAGPAYLPTGDRFDFGFRGQLSGAGRQRVEAAAFTGGIPMMLAASGRRSEVYAKAFVELIEQWGAPPQDSPKRVQKAAVANLAAKSLRQWEEDSDDPPFQSVLGSFVDDKRWLDAAVAVHSKRDELVEMIVDKLAMPGRVPYIVASEDAVVHHFGGTNLHQFLQDRTYHLAGLRVAPQPLYPFTTLASDSDVGSRGENLAMVLLTIGDREVTWARPDGSVTAGPLLEAVRVWARHLQLLDDLYPVHRGAQGVAIEVEQGGETLDVTAVGVGVSQVLPVLVRCLLANPGDLVLLEQPELHLHPAAQLALADFLYHCVRSGRQIIVETHSEHLVNRLRRRVAEDVDEPELSAQLISIVFAERRGPATEYQQIDLTTAGGFRNWPTGFFPEGVDEVRALMNAGLRKKATTRTDG